MRRPSAKYSVLALGACFVAGIVFWGGFHTALDTTNAMQFCTTCHEMRDTVYPEYKETTHYANRAGVRATCADCHVPRDWGPMMVRKAGASLELLGKLTGGIDTKEKFEANRLALANREWDRMKASNSLECRNCHSFDAMSANAQKQAPYKLHMQAREAGSTCIDCHKGIAHRLPKGFKVPAG